MKTAKKYNPDLILHGNLIRAILSLAIPVVINSFLQTMYNLTDTYWLGKIGTEQLAAINLVTPMQNIITNFGSGITVAGAVLIAQYIGAGEKEDARSMANQIFICAMGFAVVCAALCFLGTPAIVNWLGADGGTAYYARVYLRVVIWDMPFLYMVNIFSAVHQAQGDTVRPMLLNLGGITLNLFLDPFFMIILDMGTAGAALATLLAKAVPATVAFILLCRPENDICLNRRYIACGSRAYLRPASVVYGDKAPDPDAKYYVCGRYPACDCYVAAHRKTMLPMGTLADKALRKKRHDAHVALDSLWKNGIMSRKEAYRLLQLSMGLPAEDAHIAKFSAARCDEVIALSRRFRAAAARAA